MIPQPSSGLRSSQDIARPFLGHDRLVKIRRRRLEPARASGAVPFPLDYKVLDIEDSNG
jgi:hypothetical protein